MTETVQTSKEETQQVDETLRQEVAADLGMPPGELDDDASFLKLGLDADTLE